MNCKSIINAVVVAVAVMAVMLVGCGGNDNDGMGGDLVGDWELVSEGYTDSDGNNEVCQIPGNGKWFWSFRSSGDAVLIELEKFGDYWTEDTLEFAKYSVEGNYVCFFGYEDGYKEFVHYRISGNTLTLSWSYSYERCDNDGCYTYSYSSTTTAVRANLASTKSSLRVVSRNPALEETTWYKENESGYRGGIRFNDSFHDENGNYISFNHGIWYTEDDRIIILELECDRRGGYGDCSYPICNPTGQQVTLEYRLSGETLRLRPAGSNTAWDVWTPSDGYYFSQSKAKSKNGNGAISPFWALRR